MRERGLAVCVVGFGEAGQAVARALSARGAAWIALDRGGGPRVAPWLEVPRSRPPRPARWVEIGGITRDAGGFRLETTNGEAFEAPRVIVATGARAAWSPPVDLPPGAAHLGAPELPVRGPKALVIGAEPLALRATQRLWERGVEVALSLPRPAPLLSPSLGPERPLGRLVRHLPPLLADRLVRLAVRDLRAWDWALPFPDETSELELTDSPSGQRRGLLEVWREAGLGPSWDRGLGQLVRQGAVIIYPRVTQVARPEVWFEDGRRDRFETCLMAPSPSAGLRGLLSPDLAAAHLGADDLPLASGTLRDGLGFVGFDPSPLARQAARLAAAVAP